MSLVSHLKELRRRLLWCVGSVFIGAIFVWIFFKQLFSFLQKPYCNWAEEVGGDCSFLITDVLEPLSITFTVSGYGGLILALPVILFHLARFVMPALYPKEKRAIFPFIIAAVVLLFVGAAAGYLIMPRAISTLLEFNAQDTYSPNLIATTYIGFFIKMILAFGLAAELPLVLVFLQKIGIITPETLKKNRRISIALLFIFGAVITPTGDALTLIAVTLPMYVLFEVAILIGTVFYTDRQTA